MTERKRTQPENGMSTRTKEVAIATLDDLQSLRREIHNDLASFRDSFGEFQREVQQALVRKNETNWTTILTAVSVALILAGMAAALINSIISAESTQRQMAVDNLDLQDTRHQARIDKLLDRELENAYYRGVSQEKFATIQSELDAAIKNRKDIDEKHVAGRQSLEAKIDDLDHQINNGLRGQITGLMPMRERVIALEREVFSSNAFDARKVDRAD